MAGLSRNDLEGLTKACLVDPDDEELVFCHICLDSYEDPTLVPCPKQHVACRSCLQTWVKGHSTCPTCRAKLPDQELQQMRHIANQMPRVRVYCLHRCGYQGPLSTFRQHMDRCPQHLDNRITEEIDGLQKGVQAIDDEMGEIQEDRARLIQEQERLKQLRREIHEAVERGEVLTAMEDRVNQVRHQETGREALKRQVTELQQAVDAERTQRQALQRQDQPRQRRIAELEEALEFQRYRAKVLQERYTERLHQAAEEGNVADVSSLLDEGLVNLNGQDLDDRTALSLAAAEGHVDVVERLLQAGADVNRLDINEESPLSWASMAGHIEVVERLLQAGADVQCPRNDGVTALHIASWNGRLSVVERLLQAGADIEHAKDDGTTPLHAACSGGQVSVVERLLQAGANPNQASNDGQTPLSAACKYRNSEAAKPEIERLLRQAGAQ